MESIYTELALYRNKNKCARTDTIFFSLYLSSFLVGNLNIGKITAMFMNPFQGSKIERDYKPS